MWRRWRGALCCSSAALWSMLCCPTSRSGSPSPPGASDRMRRLIVLLRGSGFWCCLQEAPRSVLYCSTSHTAMYCSLRVHGTRWSLGLMSAFTAVWCLYTEPWVARDHHRACTIGRNDSCRMARRLGGSQYPLNDLLSSDEGIVWPEATAL
jgi:hypothetical protein